MDGLHRTSRIVVWVGFVLKEAEEDWFVCSLDGADEGRFSFSSFFFQVVSSGQTLFNL